MVFGVESLAAFKQQMDFAEISDVCQRIGIHNQDVGKLALLQRAEAFLLVHILGNVLGGGLNDLHRIEPNVAKQLHLLMQSQTRHSGVDWIGAVHDLSAGLNELPEKSLIFSVSLNHQPFFLAGHLIAGSRSVL